jgi:hypothetical protein
MVSLAFEGWLKMEEEERGLSVVEDILSASLDEDMEALINPVGLFSRDADRKSEVLGFTWLGPSEIN